MSEVGQIVNKTDQRKSPSRLTEAELSRIYGRFNDEEDLTKPDPDAIVETYFRFLEKFSYEGDKQDYKLCYICGKEFEDGQTVIKVPQCGHIFHMDCMK